jgi:3-hydroxyisobutyrate dehydrogenase
MAILRQSTLFAPTFDKKLPRLLKRDYKHPNFSTAHLLKDVVLCGKEAAGLGLREGVLDGLRTVLEDSNAKGLADVDYSAMYESIDPKER